MRAPATVVVALLIAVMSDTVLRLDTAVPERARLVCDLGAPKAAGVRMPASATGEAEGRGWLPSGRSLSAVGRLQGAMAGGGEGWDWAVGGSGKRGEPAADEKRALLRR